MMSFLKSLDWRLWLAATILMAAGLLSLASTAPSLFYKQLIWIGLGLSAAFLAIKFDWRAFINYRGVILGLYFLSIIFLLITYFFAPAVRGVKGWLPLGPFQFQVSELTKLILIIFYAHFFSRKHIGIAKVANLINSFIYFFIPTFLIALQPDFGTVVIIFSLWFGFLLVSGIKWRHLVIAFIIFSIVLAVLWQTALKDYQKERILGFIFPGRDQLGINYNVVQAKIAIGSAGFFGKGFHQGTQVQLGFLPEDKTDFIFAAFVEEWGLMAGLVVVLAFLFLIIEIIKIGLRADNNFNRFVCLGAVVLFIIQFVLNIGSNIGLSPVIGVTFPFMSYGGSSLLTNLVLAGIIQSIFSRRS